MIRINIVIALLFAVLQINAQSSHVVCRAGFAFEISNNPNWGKGEPVVINITPGSPAEQAGLKLNDIILEVNRKGTYLKPHQTIKAWLLDNDLQDIEISIRNLETDFRTISFDKDCKASNGIGEAKLATVFAFYSLQDVQNRNFHIPMKINSNPDADFTNYRTFDFAPEDENTPDIDVKISAKLKEVLQEYGLKRDQNDPDFIIQTYYSYQNNPRYQSNLSKDKVLNWRFDLNKKEMVKLPLFSPIDVVNDNQVPYFLEFGYRFYDRKHIDSTDMVQIWECEVKERLSSNYGLENYLETNLPLILSKYPHPGSKNLATYEVNYLRYNYTGINFNINNIAQVAYVDPNSPAAIAGIKQGDVIRSIQGVKMNNDLKALTSSYRQFINDSMELRDKSTRYTDTNGYQDCMFWEVSEYNQVSRMINKKKYRTAFMYLFNFNQYIDWDTPKTLSIEIERNNEKMSFEILPEIYNSSQISAY